MTYCWLAFPVSRLALPVFPRKMRWAVHMVLNVRPKAPCFFDVARIIAAKRPKAFVLENVKNLLSHDKGNTFKVILQTLRDALGYDVHYKVIDGQRFVPQHRERIIIMGFRDKTEFSWDYLQVPAVGPRLSSILHPQHGSEEFE